MSGQVRHILQKGRYQVQWVWWYYLEIQMRFSTLS